jgi:two-component system LytT family sensor kinase
MKHPILKDRNRFLTYLFLWLVVTVFQYFYLYSDFSTKSFLPVAIWIQNLTLASIFVGAWFGMRYINIETQKPYQFVLNHFIYLIIIIVIWISLSNLIDFIFLKEVINEYREKTKPLKVTIGVFSYLLFVAYIYLDAYYASYLEKIENERRLYEILKESELNLLKSQMNPHFIFNSLNSISSLTMLDATRAQDMIIRLSDFLRYTVNASKEQLVTLERELEMCKAYLDIEKVRFGKKISFDFEVQEESLPLMVPSMMLQTLFENAIKHGVYSSLGKETIHFESKEENGRLTIEIKNSFDPDSQPKVGTKTGLINVKNRLNLIYDHTAILETQIADNTFTVKLNLPQKHEN